MGRQTQGKEKSLHKKEKEKKDKNKRKKPRANWCHERKTTKHRHITYELSSFFLNLSTEETCLREQEVRKGR